MSYRSGERHRSPGMFRGVTLAAAVCAVVLAGAALATAGLPMRAGGWLLGGPVAATLVAVHRRRCILWSARSGRVPPRWQSVVSVCVVGTGLALSVVHASVIALDLS